LSPTLRFGDAAQKPPRLGANGSDVVDIPKGDDVDNLQFFQEEASPRKWYGDETQLR
jgi:hypothetical protein